MVVELQMKTSVAHPVAVRIHFHNFFHKQVKMDATSNDADSAF